MIRFLKYKIFLTSFLFAAAAAEVHPDSTAPELPDIPPVPLHPYGHIRFAPIKEASGLVKSRMWDNVFWTHNDSGDEPRIFPITRRGQIIKPDWMENYSGIRISDAVNVDWETITTDDQGNLYIGDVGNNSNTRRDLKFYMIREPYPAETVTTSVVSEIRFVYPDQDTIPPQKLNFDAEATFWKDGYLYLFTKHRSDLFTKLYRLKAADTQKIITATLLGKFNIRGQVSGADLSQDGRKLAVLTDNAIWLFEIPETSDNFFNGKISWLPIQAKQCEAICFDEDLLIILNEQRELFKVKVTDLTVIRESPSEKPD